MIVNIAGLPWREPTLVAVSFTCVERGYDDNMEERAGTEGVEITVGFA